MEPPGAAPAKCHVIRDTSLRNTPPEFVTYYMTSRRERRTGRFEHGLVFDGPFRLAPGVLLFRRIFDFQKTEIPHVEQRMNRRYTPGRTFPLRAELRGAQGWQSVEIRNLSATGLALTTGSAMAPAAELPGRSGPTADLRLTLGEHVLDLKARTAHAQPGDAETVCGFELLFEDFNQQKTWLQLLQPVALGSTLAPVDPARVQQREPQFIKQVFRGEADAVLSVWLAKTAGTPLHSFEFRTGEFFVQADAQTRRMEVFFREEQEDTHKGKITRPVFDMSGGANEEVRQLFRWVVPNIPDTIPDDIRTFLRLIAG